MAPNPVGATALHSVEKAAQEVLKRLYGSNPPPEQPVSNFRIAKTDRNQQIIERYEGGDTLAEIARDFNISVNRVHQIFKRWR
jgi:DNA-binding NarL/FixJ family response regulator